MHDSEEDGATLHRDRLAAAGRFLASGRHDEAAALIEAARAAEPGDPHGLNALGVLCLARGETGRALSILGAAATAYPDHPGLIANLGAAHHAAGNLDDAEISSLASWRGGSIRPLRRAIERLIGLRADRRFAH